MNFSEIQQLLKENLGINNLADIARELGVSPQAVSNWKARDRVPYKYVLKIRQQLEESNIQVSGQNENTITKASQGYPQHSYNQYFDEATISINDILLILARQLKIIIITPTIICIYVIINVLFIAESVYESSAKIMSTSGGRSASQSSGIAAQFGITLPTNQNEPVWVIPEIIKSRTLARSMLKRKFDTEKYGAQKSLLQILTFGDKNPIVNRDILVKEGVDKVIGMIKIEKNGSFYDLTISTSEPLFSRDFAIAIIEELDSHQREYNKAKSSKAHQFIEERIVGTEKDLKSAEEALKKFRDRNRRIENSPALLLEQQRLSREVVVLTSVFTTLKQQLETAKIDVVKDSEYVVVLDPPEAPLHRSKPKRKKAVIMAGIFGIGLGIAMAFIKEYIHKNGEEDDGNIDKLKSAVLQNFTDLFPFKKMWGQKN